MTVIMKTQKSMHDEKVRHAHLSAVRILKAEIEKTNGFERNLLERTEAYHLARLHSSWFSSSRREKQV